MNAGRPTKRRTYHTKEVQRRVQDLYEQGVPSDRIMEATGCTKNCVDAARRRSKVRHRPAYMDAECQARFCQRYRDGEALATLAAERGIDMPGARAVLRRNGTALRPNVPYNLELTPERVEAILSHIEAGGGVTTAIENGGVVVSQFYEWVKRGRSGQDPLCVHMVERMDAILDGPSASSRGARKYALDEHFFDAIDTEEKAWLLGFIAADGCVSGSRLMIRLSSIDVEILETIKGFLGSTCPVRIDAAKPPHLLRSGKQKYMIHSGPSAILGVTSAYMVGQLGRHGIVERKTYCLEPWDGPDHQKSPGSPRL